MLVCLLPCLAVSILFHSSVVLYYKITYLIPGCIGRGVKLGSESSSGAGGALKSGKLDIREFGDLGTWKSGKLGSIKSKRTKPKKSNKKPKKITKRKSKTKKSIKSKRRKTKFKKNKIKFRRSKRKKQQKTRAVISSLLSLSDKVKSMLRLNLNLDQSLQNFFQGISNRVTNIKKVIQEERAKQKEKKIKECRLIIYFNFL